MTPLGLFAELRAFTDRLLCVVEGLSAQVQSLRDEVAELRVAQKHLCTCAIIRVTPLASTHHTPRPPVTPTHGA